MQQGIQGGADMVRVPDGCTPGPPDSHPLMDACQPDKAASHVPQHSNASPTMPKVHAKHLLLPQNTYLTASPGSRFQLALPRNRTMYPPPLFTACSRRLDYTNSEAPTGPRKCKIYLPG